ncbi:DUF6457 domain-containing protein [Propionibacteriaceae bacterium Y2011]
MTLDEWVRSVTEELDITDLEFDTDTMHIVLDLARDAAHAVQRPAAPLTTFLVGVAVGRGRTLESAAAKATALAVRDEVGSPTTPPDPSAPPLSGGNTDASTS